MADAVDIVSERVCGTCNGEGVVTETRWRGHDDYDVEHPCPDCRAADCDERDFDEVAENRRQEARLDNAYAARDREEYRERVAIALGRSFLEELA